MELGVNISSLQEKCFVVYDEKIKILKKGNFTDSYAS